MLGHDITVRRRGRILDICAIGHADDRRFRQNLHQGRILKAEDAEIFGITIAKAGQRNKFAGTQLGNDIAFGLARILPAVRLDLITFQRLFAIPYIVKDDLLRYTRTDNFGNNARADIIPDTIADRGQLIRTGRHGLIQDQALDRKSNSRFPTDGLKAGIKFSANALP